MMIVMKKNWRWWGIRRLGSVHACLDLTTDPTIPFWIEILIENSWRSLITQLNITDLELHLKCSSIRFDSHALQTEKTRKCRPSGRPCKCVLCAWGSVICYILLFLGELVWEPARPYQFSLLFNKWKLTFFHSNWIVMLYVETGDLLVRGSSPSFISFISALEFFRISFSLNNV